MPNQLALESISPDGLSKSVAKDTASGIKTNCKYRLQVYFKADGQEHESQ
jgi:hypothetical protein